MNELLKERLSTAIIRIKRVGVYTFSELDIQISELVVMQKIAESESCSPKMIGVSEIQKDLYITKAAVSQLLNSLEKKGYIHREIDPADRRKIIVSLTPQGKVVSFAMKAHTDMVMDKIIDRLGNDDIEQLLRLFNRFADIAEELKYELWDGDHK